MSHVPHELAEEFPEYKDKIHKLKTENTHFSQLADAYHDLNRKIHRIEAEGVNVADETIEDLRKERLHLKDQIFEMIGK